MQYSIPRGTALSLASSAIFGFLYYFPPLLSPLTGTEIFGWRMMLTLPCVTLLMLLTGESRHIRDIATRIVRRPLLLCGLMASSALIGVQQWLFLWAPINGSALSVSLGYFLLPLTMLFVGRILYRDQLTKLQKAAAMIALFGVLHEVWRLGAVSWETALVALGFPAYFALRKALGTNNQGGLWFDMLLMVPVSVAAALSGGNARLVMETPALLYLLIIIAVLSALAFMSYVTASRKLPLALFGLLGYVEPVLLFIASLAIGETVSADEAMTYTPIVAAVGILALDGLGGILQSQRAARGVVAMNAGAAAS